MEIWNHIKNNFLLLQHFFQEITKTNNFKVPENPDDIF